MKVFTILLAALFPFLHTTRYKVQIVSCKQGEIIAASQGEKLKLSLFNTKITNKKGWDYTCSILDDAESVSMEIDPSSQVSQNLPVYLFADDTLVQEQLMKEGYAYPMIRNPEYTYEKQLEKAHDTTQTVAEPLAEEKAKKYPLQGPLFLGGLLVIWLGMLIWMILQKKKKTTSIKEEV